jgi:hypothetical protein
MNVNFQRWFCKMLKSFGKHFFVGYWHHLQLTQAHSTSERQKLTGTIFGLYSSSFKQYFFTVSILCGWSGKYGVQSYCSINYIKFWFSKSLYLKCRNIFNLKNVLSIILFNFQGRLTETN